MVTEIDIHPSSRTWIYQSDQLLNPSTVQELESRLKEFLPSWTSHQRHLTGYGAILHQRFLVIMVDQREVGASGCSMDTLTHFVQELEREFGISWFDRNVVAYQNREEDEIKTMPLPLLSQAFADGIIHEDTLVFDNLVDTAEKFKLHWRKPIKDSWHKRFL